MHFRPLFQPLEFDLKLKAVIKCIENSGLFLEGSLKWKGVAVTTSLNSFCYYQNILVYPPSKDHLFNVDTIILTTVKLVYKDHPRDQKNVVLAHRWSL